MNDGAFVDFFLNTASLPDQNSIVSALQSMTKKKIAVRFVSKFLSTDLHPHNRRIVEVYLNINQLHGKSDDMSRVTTAASRYERIKTVGKGAFGSAVLYKKRDDGSLVIVKEINMYDLDSVQRQSALNEVNLLSRIDHPNIISYYDSFEEDGILMIEMEYADGGTLAQYLAKSQTFLSEEIITDLMVQMLSAVSYLHDNSVLHRDLKTANIFLTADGFVKVGDFGISKIMGTDTIAQGAKTVVGTPYYISPEMCCGEPYNQKSDMWALGCILYEMTCLQKAFEGDNLPVLVNKIMNCMYEPIRGPYSSQIKLLVRELLLRVPEKRPTASEALTMLRPSVNVQRPRSFRPVSTFISTVYTFSASTISLHPVQNFPEKVSVRQISVSETHQLILTYSNEVYAWGQNSKGQLGMGDRVDRKTPFLVPTLRGRDVHSVSAGNGFSLFSCDRGAVLACGCKRFTGLGKGSDDVLRPSLVNALLRVNVVELTCSYEHCIALTEENECFVWGSGECGKLGTGDSQHVYDPTKITVPTSVGRVITARCGIDATVLLTETGHLIAMGSNKYNKLNLACRTGFFSKEEKVNVECFSLPTVMKTFPARAIDVDVGRNNLAVILESGQVFFFGCNSHGELGLAHTDVVPLCHMRPVKSLLSKPCSMAYCGDGYSLVGTTESELYFWGSKGIVRSSIATLQNLDDTKDVAVVQRVANEEKAVSRWGVKRKEKLPAVEHIVPLPALILRLDSDLSEYKIRLSMINGRGENVFVVIDSSNSKSIINTSENSPNDNDSTIVNTWLKNEFENAEIIPMSAQKRKAGKGRNSSVASDDIKIQMSESALMKEIESLKSAISQQSSTFQGQQDQMTALQEKLLELQARQAYLRNHEPPPAYAKKTILFPENGSKTCSIL
ncbi:unnamed protein product [Auanema sp. JU1783]|nr:unnamed protein product [Auanema sp. JU1783]